jgi:hypothetical protein
MNISGIFSTQKVLLGKLHYIKARKFLANSARQRLPRGYFIISAAMLNFIRKL